MSDQNQKKKNEDDSDDEKNKGKKQYVDYGTLPNAKQFAITFFVLGLLIPPLHLLNLRFRRTSNDV